MGERKRESATLTPEKFHPQGQEKVFFFALNKVLNGSVGLKMDQKGLKSVLVPKIPFPSIHHS